MRGCFLLLLLAACSWAGPRTVWSGPEVTLLGGPSRDGKYLSYVERGAGHLAVREIATGKSWTVKRAPSGQYAYFSTISPDSGRIAFAWFNEQGFYDLRVTRLDGSGERVLYRNEEAGFVQPCDWSADGKQILVLLFRSDNTSQIAMFPESGGPPAVLRSLNWVYPKRMDLSPDGRYLVYDSFADRTSGERTVFLLSVNGDRETRLVTAPGNHLFPLWTADGRSVVFASEHEGAMGAWIVNVQDAKPVGPPRALHGGLGRALPMAITDAGEYFYGIQSAESDVFVTALADPAARPLRATIRFPKRNSAPAWSADGKLLAYLSRRGFENFGEDQRAIVIRSVESGGERELAPKLAHMERLRWSADGRVLLVSGSDGKGRTGLFTVDAASGALRGAPVSGAAGCWSADGQTLYYLSGGGEVRAREASGKEASLYSGERLRLLTISPDGNWLATVEGEERIALIPAAGGEKRAIPFAGATELEWGTDLIAARGKDLWIVPVYGGSPRRLEMPGNRIAGFSLHPDGKRLALTAGRSHAEVRVLSLPR